MMSMNIYVLLAVLIVYSIYLPITEHFDISISMLLLGGIGFFSVLNYKKARVQKPLIMYLFLTITLFFPIFYSSVFTQGILYLIKNVYSVFLLCIGLKLSQRGKADKILRNIVIVSLPLLIANVFFAFDNNAEEGFLNSTLAKFVVSPTSLVSWRTNNITDINKAGTIFPNTNNASVFFAIILSVCFFCWIKEKKKRYILFSLLAIVAILTTGCRTGIIVILIDLYVLLFVTNKKTVRQMFSIGLAVFVILLIVRLANFDFITNTINRLNWNTIKQDPRIVIWGFAVKKLNIIGYGYGGWERLVKELPAYYAQFPPHNHMLVLMFIGGIVPVVAYLYFWMFLIAKSYKRYKGNKNSYALLLLMSCIAIITHGMFDNYFILQTNIMQLIFVIIGLCYGNLMLGKSKNLENSIEGKNECSLYF